ncbi:hypothetical protein K7X08_021530 [Anisodus acutangulus]|uniref:A20-type domain-containing protein n=1 Tax=Anisodus acutangulus TaxID=402998 RepID=A0A9Q1REG3_9SOLA|nr:hypothetical protein K7X08_021530 [Anisodus acutangulus]
MAEEQRMQEAGRHRLCANNCGFFGSPTTLNLCSKCYKDHCMKEQQSRTAQLAMEKTLPQQQLQSELTSTYVSCTKPLPILEVSQPPKSENVVELEVPQVQSDTAPEGPQVQLNSAAGDPQVQLNVVAKAPQVQSNRCDTCRKRVGLTGFKSNEIAGMPGVLSVIPDPDFNSMVKDYSYPNGQLSSPSTSYTEGSSLFPAGTSKHWLVRMARPSVGVIRKGPVVDYYVQVLTKVLGNEKDAQMCLYHVSWQSNYGFCCELDEACAQELAGVPGVLSVQPDENFDSDNKAYGGGNLKLSKDSQESAASNGEADVRTKKLFVTGLSFYTFEKTLRAAFEGYGELVEVKIIAGQWAGLGSLMAG